MGRDEIIDWMIEWEAEKLTMEILDNLVTMPARKRRSLLRSLNMPSLSVLKKNVKVRSYFPMSATSLDETAAINEPNHGDTA